MMSTNKKINIKKCSLYIKNDAGDGQIVWNLTPTDYQLTCQDEYQIYTFDININTVNTFVFEVTERIGTSSYVHVDKIIVDGIKIDDINPMSNFKTFGYIDRVGKFYIKLHTNPIGQNYLNFLLSLSNKKNTV
jgi:hypothetical protein